MSVAQDLDLWLRSSKINDLKIISTAEPLYIYREENNVTKDKMLRAYKNERNMILKYGNSKFNSLIFKTYLKSIVVVMLDLLGKIEVLQKNRGQGEITPLYIESFNKAIDKIENTKVPGLNV